MVAEVELFTKKPFFKAFKLTKLVTFLHQFEH